jgi:hypothetical protein
MLRRCSTIQWFIQVGLIAPSAVIDGPMNAAHCRVLPRAGQARHACARRDRGAGPGVPEVRQFRR